MAYLGPGTILAAGDAVRTGKIPPSKSEHWGGEEDKQLNRQLQHGLGWEKHSMLVDLESEVHGQELVHQGCPSREDGV